MAQQYMYKGPVMEFGRCLLSDFEAYTYAVTPAKARSNIAYRFKKANNLAANAKINLPGRITEVI